MDSAEYKRFEQEAYDQVAAAWTARVAASTALYSRRLVELAAPGPGSRVLDLACGSGHLAAEALQRGCRVVALDLSQGMLEQARALAAAGCVRADAEQLPFIDAAFDFVFSGLGLMYFPDTARALAEVRRVLRPGGRAGFVVWAPAPRVACLRVAMSALAEETAPGAARWLFRAPGLGEALLFRILEDRIPGKGPSPLRFGRPGRIARTLEHAGFIRAGVVEHTAAWRYDSFDD
ncbi:MAG: class I SAM-dependent methyltransferase, partial [Bryobacteraceae bacterium]